MSDGATIQVRLYFEKGGTAHVDDVTPEATRITVQLKSGRSLVFRPTGQIESDGRVVFLQVPGTIDGEK